MKFNLPWPFILICSAGSFGCGEMPESPELTDNLGIVTRPDEAPVLASRSCGDFNQDCCDGACRSGFVCDLNVCLEPRMIREYSDRQGHKTSGAWDSAWDGKMAVACPLQFPKLIECKDWTHEGNGDADYSKRSQTTNACVCDMHHDSKSFGGAGHWVYCGVTAVCANR